MLQIVQHNQFSDNLTKDPNFHLSAFVWFADTLKSNGIDSEAIKLSLFPFFLSGKAKAWL